MFMYMYINKFQNLEAILFFFTLTDLVEFILVDATVRFLSPWAIVFLMSSRLRITTSFRLGIDTLFPAVLSSRGLASVVNRSCMVSL